MDCRDSKANINGPYSFPGILKTPYRAPLDMLRCFLLLVGRCFTKTRVQSTSSRTCPSRNNVCHIVTSCLFYKTLVLFTTTSNLFGHARGSFLRVAMNNA